jgi:pectate lyase
MHLARFDSTLKITPRARWSAGLAALLWLVSGIAADAARYGSSFPGAEGYGSKSRGGRGGRVLIVDSLEDRVGNPAPGTLRWALRQSGKRIIIFRVAGTIELAGKLHLENPFATVAGQTAPGEGITLKNFPLVVHTHDIVIQGIRVRIGDRLDNSDAFNIQGPRARNIVVDHCSFSWSTDEVVATNAGARNITFQNSIVSEGLDCSIHPEGCHSRGLLLRDGSRNITLHHNFFAHNDFRNPKLFGDPAKLRGRQANFHFYNNVVYDWGDWAVAGFGVARISVENNYFRLGPSTFGYPESLEIRSAGETDGYLLWAEGNIGPSCPSGCVDEWRMVHGTESRFRAKDRLEMPAAFPTSALEARDRVEAEAGASYRLDETGNRVPRRDAVDRRLFRQFRNGTGGIIDDPAEVGGWPLLDPGLPVVDSDLDGMPDAWENLFDLDPFDAADALGNLDGDRYSNIEEYLFEIDPTSRD